MYGLPITDHRELPVMTTDYAHVIMRSHIDCPTLACPVKRQAKRCLVDAGQLAPDSHRDRTAMGY
ncbi:hypothetical protein [Nocardia mexicana]|uniref:Uncharacterized protein n=1 Tax=Nocardia mexicana TaxID=279262 RepID=A0A370H6P1_9NOCA|nr:hypothetical protein [Nocardia mexicana]RDI51152.1 hypothetical protein DFR68_105630 [Nocardia mexicana]